MIKKVDLGPARREVFAEPSPLGLIGLAIGCAALLPMTFGYGLTPAGLKTAAIFCLLFGGGCQLLSGLMSFTNGNLFGGTLLTAFSFSWFTNYWALTSLAAGTIPDPTVVLAVDVAMLIIFLVFTYGFGFFSKLLFAFLVDIDLLYVARLLKHACPRVSALDVAIAAFTILLAVIALWLAFGALINITAGKQLFKIPGPLFVAPKRTTFDWKVRFTIFDVLYKHWRENAFDELSLEELRQALDREGISEDLSPTLCYLQEYGALQLAGGKGARLTASGIDLYEQLILKKYNW
jgi:uncharacterized protein